MIRSFRLQLTAWYVAFFSLLFALFGLYLYSVFSHALASRLDQTLASQAATAGALMADELVEEKGDAAKAATEVTSELRGSTVAILLDGRVLASSAPFVPGGFETVGRTVVSDPRRVAARFDRRQPGLGAPRPALRRSSAHRACRPGRLVAHDSQPCAARLDGGASAAH